MINIKTYESFNYDNFKQWFGNSKMIDENNEPKVFYHGVGRLGKFDTFKEDLIGSTSGNSGHFGQGFYFTDSKGGAENFSTFYGGTGDVMEVYLKIENPFIVNEKSLIYLGEKYNLNLPEKFDISIDIDDLLSQLKEKDLIAYELLSLIHKHKDYSKGWKEFMSNHNGKQPHESSTGIDLNTVSDWYEDTQYERYDRGVSGYTIKELQSIGIEPKFNQDYDEDIRMDYLTDLGQSTTDWTNSIKKEGHDGIVAGEEFVVFNSNQIKSVDNKGSFRLDTDNINENLNLNDKILKSYNKFRNNYTCSLEEINSGSCDEISYDVIKDVVGDMNYRQISDIDVEDVEIDTVYEIDDGSFWTYYNGDEVWNIDSFEKFGIPPFDYKNIFFTMKGHVWIYYNGKHYDVESPNGVDNFWNLKIYQRQLSKRGLLYEKSFIGSDPNLEGVHTSMSFTIQIP